MKTGLLKIIIALFAISGCGSNKQITRGPSNTRSTPPAEYQTHSGWVTLSSKPGQDGFFIFRRYTTNDSGFQNVMMYNCSPVPDQKDSYITIVMPNDYTSYKTNKNTLLSNTKVTMLIDGKKSLTINGEYNNGELFIDNNMKQVNAFRNILLADSIEISFDAISRPIKFVFTEKVDGFFEDVKSRTDLFGSQGEGTHFSRYETIEACEHLPEILLRMKTGK